MEDIFTNDLVDEDRACKLIGGEDTPIHRSTLRRGINAGRYPRPIKVGPGTNRWHARELIAAVERAAAERDRLAAKVELLPNEAV